MPDLSCQETMPSDTDSDGDFETPRSSRPRPQRPAPPTPSTPPQPSTSRPAAIRQVAPQGPPAPHPQDVQLLDQAEERTMFTLIGLEETGSFCPHCLRQQNGERLADPILVQELLGVNTMLLRRRGPADEWGVNIGLEGLDVLRGFRRALEYTLRYLNFFTLQADAVEQLDAFHAVWARLYDVLAFQLLAGEERMQGLAHRANVRDFHPPYERPPPSRPCAPPSGEDNSGHRCTVCLDRPADHVSRSCGHVFCQECIFALLICAICRRPICGRMRVYF